MAERKRKTKARKTAARKPSAARAEKMRSAGEDEPLHVEEEEPGERGWKAACHFSTLVTFVGFFATMTTPLGNLPGIVAPLVLWFALAERHPTAVPHAREALNFQLNVFLAGLIGWALTATGVCCCLGLPILLAIAVANAVLSVIAGLRALDGEFYRYPYALRLLD